MNGQCNRRVVRVALGLLVAGSVMLWPDNTDALLIAGPDIIAVPPDVTDAGAVNNHQQAFDERQNVVLPAPLVVDGGVIGADTVVSSHMIFLNTDGSASVHDIQTWTFDGIILGVMSDIDGTLEAASTALLGALGTIYPLGFLSRGLEIGDSYLLAGNAITLDSTSVTEPGDWIRVITSIQSIPEPSTLLLLGAAAIGLLGPALQRNRRKCVATRRSTYGIRRSF